MRVLIITEDDPIYVSQFFNRFFEVVDRSKIEICGMTISHAFHEPLLKTARRMWRFYGPWNFIRLLKKYFFAKLARRSVARLAAANAVPLLETTSVNDADYVNRVRKLGPDLILSVAAPEIFKRPLLTAARLGCINIHSGRLPKYRGMMPVFWQMKHGEQTVTVTIHEMAPKLDAGAILATHQFPIHGSDSLNRLIIETKKGGAELMAETLIGLKEGRVEPIALDMSEKDYFSFPSRSDVVAFRARGHQLL